MTMDDTSDVSRPGSFESFEPSKSLSRRIVRCNFSLMTGDDRSDKGSPSKNSFSLHESNRR